MADITIADDISWLEIRFENISLRWFEMKMQKNFNILSIIVPIHNVEKYLKKCIGSIIDQTYHNIQIILVDDGSVDASGRICDYYAEKEERIQVIHKENGGLVSARKAGLAVATGDYVSFVDGDDYIEADLYEKMMKDMLENDVDFVHTGYVCQDKVYNYFNNKRYELSEEISSQFIAGIFGEASLDHITPSIWSKLFKKEFIMKSYAKVPNEQSYGEDLISLCVCLLEGKSVYLHNLALYHYVKREGSLTDLDFASNIIRTAELYNVLKALFLEYGVYERLRLYLESYFLRMTISAMGKLGKGNAYMALYYYKEIDSIRGKRIIIYGAGKVGQDYYTQLRRFDFCCVAGWVDRDYQKYHYEYAEVLPIQQLKNLHYDVILIAIKNKDIAQQAKLELMESWGIAEGCIIWEEPKAVFDGLIL